MKWHIIGALLLFGGISLNAQNLATVSFYVPVVTGSGSAPEDNDSFTEYLTWQIGVWHGEVKKRGRSADFSLVGVLGDAASFENEVATNPYGGGYALRLDLYDNKTDTALYGEVVFYDEQWEVLDSIPYTLFKIFFTALGTQVFMPDDARAWRGQEWYFGGAVFWAPRVYRGENRSTTITNFGMGITAEYHFAEIARKNKKLNFLRFVSAETGFELAPDWVVAFSYTNETYWDMILGIPLLFKAVLKPSTYFMLEPYLGLNFNISLSGTTHPFPVSGVFGFQYGVRVGPGSLYIDPRLSIDFGKSSVALSDGTARKYNRFVMYIGVGYKYGVFPKHLPVKK